MTDFNLKRIYNTRNYIETHYNKVISVDSLEAISNYSYRNLQRVFYSLFKETIGAYQTRLKIENGYKKILYSSTQISDIALQVGFADVQSFSKTFKKHFKCSPSFARNQKELLLNDTHPQQKVSCTLESKIVFIPEITVYYSSCKTSYINPEIEDLWEAILDSEYPEPITDFFGIITDDILITEKSKCTYDACIVTKASIRNLPTKKIFGGKYANFFHKGGYDSLEDTYQQIFGGWFLSNSIEFSHLPVIEQYIMHEANCNSKSDYLTAIFIPLT